MLGTCTAGFHQILAACAPEGAAVSRAGPGGEAAAGVITPRPLPQLKFKGCVPARGLD